MFFFLAVLVAVLVIAVVPIVIFSVLRTVTRLAQRESAAISMNRNLEARLSRMEEAIDAMAAQIERMRTGDDSAIEPDRSRAILPPADHPTFDQ